MPEWDIVVAVDLLDSAPIRLPPPKVYGGQRIGSQYMAIKGVKQKTVSTAIPKMPLLHRREHVKAILWVFFIAVLDGRGGLVDIIGGRVVWGVHEVNIFSSD
jgi:hypothetical protein